MQSPGLLDSRFRGNDKDAGISAGIEASRGGIELLLHHGDVGRVLVLHADDMVARVDMQNLAGHAASEVGEKIERTGADILDGNAAPERRVVFVPLEDIAEVGDALRGERLERPGSDSDDSDITLT